MSRRFTFVTLALTAVVAFLVGAIFAGGVTRTSVTAGNAKQPLARSPARAAAGPAASSLNFADVVERINPAVVSVDATSRVPDSRRRRGHRFLRIHRRDFKTTRRISDGATATPRGAAPAPASSSTPTAASSPISTSSIAPNASSSSWPTAAACVPV